MEDISFIIPTYNNKELLIRCLNYIQIQMDLEDEIIIIDDGSTDGTFEVISKKYEDYSNITIYRQDNSGSGQARNRGVSLSKNKYIWFVDSDDYIAPGSIKKIKESLHQTKIDILFFDFYMNKIEQKSWKKLNLNKEDKISLLLSLQVPWNKVIKKDIIKDVKFPTGKIRYQDHGTLPILITLSENFEYLAQPLYIYDFSHPNNMGKKLNKNDDIYIAFENLVKYAKKGYISSHELEVLFISTFVFSQIYNPSDNKFNTIYSNIKKVKKYLTKKFPDWKSTSLLTIKFKNKYSRVVDKLSMKIIIGRILKWNDVIPAFLIYIFKKQ